MKLAGWQLVVVIVALLAVVTVLGIKGVLDAKAIGLALSTVAAWLVPSPFAQKLPGASVAPPPPEAK